MKQGKMLLKIERKGSCGKHFELNLRWWDSPAITWGGCRCSKRTASATVQIQLEDWGYPGWVFFGLAASNNFGSDIRKKAGYLNWKTIVVYRNGLGGQSCRKGQPLYKCFETGFRGGLNAFTVVLLITEVSLQTLVHCKLMAVYWSRYCCFLW